MMSWKLQTIDTTAAFLQGSSLARELFLYPPYDVCLKIEVSILKNVFMNYMMHLNLEVR